jgi:hypothetical protein
VFYKEIPMTENKPRYLKIKDKEGNEFLCPLEALKNVKDASKEELDSCVEGDVVGRYGGNIEITN